jgi:hypothetical protein
MATYIPGVTDIFPEPSLFTPDFSYMDKMLQRRQQMYEQGFAQVNSKYNFINRDISNPQNLTVRDEFLKQAKINLKDLSALDLSEQQNVTTATSVFEPFVKNTNVLGDQALTEHWNQQRQVAESFRLKDGGKEFSEDNINYVLMQQKEFASGSPDSWGSFYSSRRSFNPYYDWNKEITDKMKDFKPDETSVNTPKGFYFYKNKDASVEPDAVKRYLNGVLSDKAKQQMRIEATVRYGSKPEAVAGAYQQVTQSNLKSINKALDEVNVELKVEKDKNRVEQLKEYRSKLEDSKSTYSSEVNKMKSGDFSFLKGKIESIAFDLYYDDTVNKIANGYARKVYERDVTVNSAAVDIWKDGQTWARQKDDQEFKLQQKKLEDLGSFIDNPVITVPPLEDDKSTAGMKDLNTAYEKTNVQLSGLSSDFTDFMLNYWKGDGITNQNDALTAQDLMKNPALVKKFISENAGLKEVVDFQMKSNYYQGSLNNMQGYVNAAKTAVTSKLSASQVSAINQFVNNSKSLGNIGLRSSDGSFKKYSSDKIAKGLIDGSVSYSYRGKLGVLNIDGEEFTFDREKPNAPTLGAINKINQLKSVINQDKNLSSSLKKYDEAISGYFNESSAIVNKAIVVGDDSKMGKDLISILSGMIPITGGTISISGLKQQPTKSRTYFNVVPGSDKSRIKGKEKDEAVEVTEDNVLAALTAYGIKAGKSSAGLYIDDPKLIQASLFKNYTPIEMNMYENDKFAGDGFNSTFWWPLDAGVDGKGRLLPSFRYSKRVNPQTNSTKYYLYDGQGGSTLGSYDDLHTLIIDAKSYSLDPNSYRAVKNK